MGGSSLAPEVITRTAGVELTVLDTTDPGAVRRGARPTGSTAPSSWCPASPARRSRPTASAVRSRPPSAAAGSNPGRAMVAVTDPGSGLAELRDSRGYRRVFLADPSVGGRYSALTAFGLVPVRAGRCRRVRAARRGSVRGTGAGPPTTRATLRSSSARLSVAASPPAGTRWPSPTPAPGSSALPTGQSN